ncbi:uncharacterized protein [Halyomorpha halys]|uniref:uncharacterized protein isoform X2 n=1 Tax=Halyomorpha halys TaxID=286706 RepID=UPI0034D25C04
MWLRLSWWAFRAAVVLSVASMAALVLYFTPLPDLYFASCERPCHELDWPMICRFRLVLESHQSMGGWCGSCPQNITDCFRHGCILADGSAQKVLTANKQLPGPSIQVCENDILVVDVVNRLPGQGVAIHWRGQSQKESPYMDGVPMITQCPISSYTTFQYKFRASHAGTHLWHAHTGNEVLDNLFGALIVRKADRMEESKKYYDKDDKHHTLVFSEWGSSILVNGVSSPRDDLASTLVLDEGFRYRIRIAHAGGARGCPFYFRIENHTMLVVVIDGADIQPIRTSVIKIAQGERMDFILEASNEPQTYLALVESNCTESFGLAKIRYNSTLNVPGSKNVPQYIPQTESFPINRLVSTVHSEECDQDGTVCLFNMKSLKKIPAALSQKKVDIRLYLPFDYVLLAAGISGIRELKPRLNNITFMFPPSPILSQGIPEGSEGTVCSQRNSKECSESSPICECTHVINIPLHSTVEIILINQDILSDINDHVFHLHGQRFYITSVATDIPHLPVSELKKLDEKGLLLKRNLIDPVIKDTITVPRSGAVALRFKADNPGYWLLHEQSSSEWANGLDVVLRVGGKTDLPPVPDNFPTCGSWVGPQFFLI